MKRRLLNVLTGLSLLLCVAACVLWVRSYRATDYVGWQSVAPDGINMERTFFVVSLRGRVHVQRDDQWFPAFTPAELADLARFAGPDRPRPGWRWGSRASRAPSRLTGSGFSFERTNAPLRYALAGGRQQAWMRGYLLSVPYWFLALATATLPGWRGIAGRRRRRREKRLRHGLCLACGYDLRAPPGRCPECGTNASASTTG
jgi:hypothetical protein